MKSFFLSISIILSLILLFQCNPTGPPTLTTMTPGSKVFHMPTFTLNIRGNDIGTNTRIVFSGVEKQTTYVNNTTVTCEIEPDDIATPGSIPVLLRNTGVGNDAESSTVYFTVRPHHTFPSKILITQPIHPENAGFGYFDIDFDSEDNLNLVWEEIIREPGGSCTVRIYYMRSQNSGDSWINLSEIGISGSVHNGDPAIAVDPSDNLHVTFSNLGEIYYQNSSDNGSSWSAPIFLYGTVGNYSYGVPDIDIDPSGRIYIIFKGPGGLYLTSSTDNGNTWSQPLNFINTSGGTSKPNISVDTAGTINIATNDQGDHFVFTRSTDYGSTWSTPFYPGASYLWSYGSRVAAHNPGDVFLLWYSKINADSENLIYFKRGENNGQIWTPNINIGENFTGEITTDSAGNVNTVLEKNFETAFKRSVNRGDTWEPPVTLDFILVRAMGLDQAGNIYIVGYAQWEYDIYLIRSDH